MEIYVHTRINDKHDTWKYLKKFTQKHTMDTDVQWFLLLLNCYEFRHTLYTRIFKVLPKEQPKCLCVSTPTTLWCFELLEESFIGLLIILVYLIEIEQYIIANNFISTKLQLPHRKL